MIIPEDYPNIITQFNDLYNDFQETIEDRINAIVEMVSTAIPLALDGGLRLTPFQSFIKRLQKKLEDTD